MPKMTKFAIVTRDWKGSYEGLDAVKGMIFHGAEDDIQTLSDSFAMCFVDGETDLSPQDLYAIWYELSSDDVEGYEAVDDVFTKVKE